MATTKRDYYEVLGVGRTATEEEIRKSYRRLAFQYHPDRNADPGAAETFKEVKEAYEVLADGEKRSMYDRFGHLAGERGFGNGASSGFAGFGIEDIFESFFGAASGATGRRQRVQRGADLRTDVTLTLEEAVFGAEKEISYPKHEVCTHCSGNGAEPGREPVRCPRCSGTGEIRRSHQSIFGQMVNVSMCDRCRGEGTLIQDPCKECRGQGVVRTTKTLRVSIPAGIDDNSQIRLANEGEPGPHGAAPGHLYLVIHVQPHRYFRRQGNDLLVELPINVAQAALGDELEIESLDGPVQIKIQAGTQSGRVVRVRGKGVPYLRDQGRGDLQVRLKIAIPTDLTPTQRDLFRKLAATFDGQAVPQENKGFFEKVKDAFIGFGKASVADTWLELSAVAEPEAADAVAEIFGRWGRGVAIEQPVLDAPDGDGGWVDPDRNVVVKTYLAVDGDVEARRRLLEEATWHLGRLRHVEPLQVRGLAEDDWAHAWKRFFFPHRVGRRLVIVPSWRRRARRPDDLVIRLDPGMAFGTGLHPTTRMCLALLEEHLQPGQRVLDFGCGSAILSIAAVRLGAARVLALDIDEVAVRVAEENVRRNRVVRRVGVRRGSVDASKPLEGVPFDLAVANISALVLKKAQMGLAAALRPGAVAILSGVLLAGADDVRRVYEDGGWQHVETRIEGDWIAMVVRRAVD